MLHQVRSPAHAGLPRSWISAIAIVVSSAGFFLSAHPAQAVVKGTTSALERHTVRIVRGAIRCSGVVIARNLIASAAHCGGRGVVIAGAARIAIAGASRSATLDDGRRVSVSGDAVIARLTRPLPPSVTPVAVGAGGGETYTIAGYGTADERRRGAYGQLREARLVAAERFALVDPGRTGPIGASACFGDSGGPVLRGAQLVGIITRAAHPHPRIACGYLTRWAPISVSGEAVAAAAPTDSDLRLDGPRKASPRKKARQPSYPVWSWFRRPNAR